MSVEILAGIQSAASGTLGPGMGAIPPAAGPTAIAGPASIAGPAPIAGVAPGAVQATGSPSSVAEVQRPSFRDTAVRTDITIRADAAPRGTSGLDAVGDKVLSHLDKISRDHMAGGAQPDAERVKFVDAGTLAEHGTGSVGATGEARFERQMDLLKMSFDHAVEVELAGKTGTGLSSSMNKLMSGS